MIWSIRGNGALSKSYLVATLPVQDSTFYTYPNKIWTYLNNSDVFLYSDTKQELYPEFEQHFGVFPTDYFKSTAEQQLKPVIPFRSKPFPFASKGEMNTQQQQELRDAFLSGNLSRIQTMRQEKDISNLNSSELENVKYNLLLEIEQAIRLQPIFIVVDAAYVTGSTGLPNLLQSKGFQVKAEQTKFYQNNAKEILARKQLPNVPANNSPNQPIIPSSQIEPYEGPLNLPIGIYNLNQWGEYELQNLLAYQAPSRLRQIDNQSIFESTANGLTYTISLNNPSVNTQQELGKQTIKTGGQLVKTARMNMQGMRATEAEFMLSESRLVLCLIVEHPAFTVSISVEGNTPQIFSIEASKFLQSIAFLNVALAADSGVSSNSSPGGNPMYPQPSGGQQNQPQASTWVAQNIMDQVFFLPRKPEEISSKTDNGELKSYVIPRGSVDKNVYVISASKREQTDLFRLFNQSINEATSEVRGVVEDSSVMPVERPNSAEYIVRDAVGNYYRIIYFTSADTFYQFVIMGDKKSIENRTVSQILTSVFRTN